MVGLVPEPDELAPELDEPVFEPDGLVTEPIVGSSGADAALVFPPNPDCRGTVVAVVVKACVPAVSEPEVNAQAPLLLDVVVPICVVPS